MANGIVCRTDLLIGESGEPAVGAKLRQHPLPRCVCRLAAGLLVSRLGAIRLGLELEAATSSDLLQVEEKRPLPVALVRMGGLVRPGQGQHGVGPPPVELLDGADQGVAQGHAVEPWGDGQERQDDGEANDDEGHGQAEPRPGEAVGYSEHGGSSGGIVYGRLP